MHPKTRGPSLHTCACQSIRPAFSRRSPVTRLASSWKTAAETAVNRWRAAIAAFISSESLDDVVLSTLATVWRGPLPLFSRRDQT